MVNPPTDSIQGQHNVHTIANPLSNLTVLESDVISNSENDLSTDVEEVSQDDPLALTTQIAWETG